MSGNSFSFASSTVLRNRDGSVASTALDMLQALRSREQSVAPQSGPAAAGALGTPPAGLAEVWPLACLPLVQRLLGAPSLASPNACHPAARL